MPRMRGQKGTNSVKAVLVRDTSGTKDPAMFDAHRRLRGPLIRATGPGSYDEWKTQLAAERAAKRVSHG